MPTEKHIRSWESPNREKINKTPPQWSPNSIDFSEPPQGSQTPCPGVKLTNRGAWGPASPPPPPISSPRLHILPYPAACTTTSSDICRDFSGISISTTMLFRTWGSNAHHECQTVDACPGAGSGWQLKWDCHHCVAETHRKEEGVSKGKGACNQG